MYDHGVTRFSARVWATVCRHRLLEAGDRVLVALSGGADSVALLHVLVELAPRAGATLAGVIHVHHGLRGVDADGDAEFCRQLADARGLPFELTSVDVPAEAARRRWSTERAAHVLRHRAFRDAVIRVGATRIAVGHTLDDQAETVVLRFLRGAGTRGLAGIWPSHGALIRPLLDVSRADVEQFLLSRSLSWREDATNRDVSIPRNAVRHLVLPALKAVAGATLPERLSRQAAGWQDDERWLTLSVASKLPSVLVRDPAGGWVLDLTRLAAVPDALRRRVRLEAARQMLPHGRVLLRQVETLECLAGLRPGAAGRLGPWVVRRDGPRLRFALAEPSVAGPAVVPTLQLDVPGVLEVPGTGVQIEASVVRRDGWKADDTPTPGVVALDAERVGEALVVRARRPGDRMRPSGAPGSQKVQDLLVNRKVPRHRRDGVPIITTADGRIAWVMELAVGEEFAIKAATTAVLLLKATRPGGKA